jgi:putative ABC transport system permease protein
MSWLDGLRHRVAALLDPERHERELRQEMAFHEELDRMQQGDASRARRRFGNRTWYQEETRRMTWAGSLDVFRQDLGFAFRSIRRAPGHTAAVVVTLALGIGLNTATFSVLDHLYLRPPAGVDEPGQLRRVWIESHRFEGGIARSTQAMHFPAFRLISDAVGDSTRVAAITNGEFRLGGTRRGPELNGRYPTANYFDLLGVQPLAGRVYSRDEARPRSGANVAVISHRLWRTHLGAEPDILGRTIRLDNTDYTVIGIAPRGFDGIDLQPTDVWLPIGIVPQGEWLQGKMFESPRMHVFRAIARFESAAEAAAFTQRATPLLRDRSRLDWPTNPDTLLNVQTGSVVEARGPGETGPELAVSSRLSGVAVIVLLIAAANVINLLLARAVSRRREFAVRMALGISRLRLVRLLTTETVVLALLAAIAAMLLGWWGGHVLRALLLPDVQWTGPALHMRVVWFTLGIALLAGIVAGLVPGIRFSRREVTRDLKEGARDGAAQHARLQHALVAVQAALSVVLLVGAGLFISSLRNVRAMDIGFDADQVIYARVAYDPGQSPGATVVGAAYMELESRLLAQRDVEAVGRAAILPLGGFSFFNFYWGSDSSESLRQRFPVMTAVSRGYFPALGLRMLRGRTFDEGLAASNQLVVNEAMARMLWPQRGIDVIGECVRFDKRDAPCHTVVGVVETSRRSQIIEEPAPQYYMALGVPRTQAWGAGASLVVRVRADAKVAAMREISATLRRALPTGDPVVQAMSDDLEPQYRPWKLGAALFSGVSALAFLVALVGTYSSVSYVVNQRRHEFGIRRALGASTHSLLRHVVAGSVRVVVFGVLLGVALALAGGRLISAMLYGVTPADPAAMLLAAAALVIMALVAAALPAWRAAQVDPASALRAD